MVCKHFLACCNGLAWMGVRNPDLSSEGVWDVQENGILQLAGNQRSSALFALKQCVALSVQVQWTSVESKVPLHAHAGTP